jgi:hypothetical protein
MDGRVQDYLYRMVKTYTVLNPAVPYWKRIWAGFGCCSQRRWISSSMGELISRDMAIASHGHAALPLPSHVHIHATVGCPQVQLSSSFILQSEILRDYHRMGDRPTLGGKWAIVLFAVALLAFVAESELTQVRLSGYPVIRLLLTWFLSMCKLPLIFDTPSFYCMPYQLCILRLSDRFSIQLYRSLFIHDYVPNTLAFLDVETEYICSLALDRSLICYRATFVTF